MHFFHTEFKSNFFLFVGGGGGGGGAGYGG